MERMHTGDGSSPTDQEAALQKLPHAAKLSWGLVKPSTRGPKGELSVRKIVDAAIAIADRDGLAAVSMNRVAASLGFTTMSLYRYLSSKDDLLLLMYDAVSDIELPERTNGDWRAEMRAYVRVCVEVFVRHPWFGDIPVTTIPIMPNTLKIIDWLMGTMRSFPLNEHEKMSILLLLSSYSRSVGIISRDFDQALKAGADPDTFNGLEYSAALKQLVQPESYPYLHPLVMSGTYAGENEQESTVGDDFDFGLERILDGIQRYLDAKRKS
ncbi:TetR/AcrR family transcriptional regulator [Cohnella hongkongensis]|uniref:TetR/AcrR family transcriptional regulator n=1 Tax=Cohnella hongkongensis TaxID=178337 RepID=A0ABV9F6X3_9BACL